MSFEFRYRFITIGKKEIPYPFIPLTLKTFLGKREYIFILDTGADITALPYFMISLLGIEKSRLQKSSALGVGTAPVTTFEGHITIQLKSLTLTIPCVFTDSNKTPLLLGKEGIFDHFNIYFDNDRNKTVFTQRKMSR